MIETVFEIGRFATMVGILTFVLWVGRARDLWRNSAWQFSVLAFLLLIFGVTIDVIDDYDVLIELFGWQESLLTVVLEKGVGYLGGFCFLLLAATRWLPKADALRHEKELAEEKYRQRSNMIANMSHELRTPLNAILGFSEVIAEESYGPAGQTKYVEYGADINYSAKHLLNIINNLLDLSRIEAGATELNETWIDLVSVIDHSVLMIERAAEDKRVALAVQWAVPPRQMLADETRVQQVLINVLANAVKFTPEGGQVALTIDEKQGALQINIADTGVGMNEDDVEIAFTPFGQIVSDAHISVPGSGLGLPIARLLMRAHGGDLTIRSARGQGTTVTMSFPRERMGARTATDRQAVA